MSLESHQRDALERAYDLLKEHFDTSLIVVTTEIADRKEASQIFWAGGYIAAVGNAHYAASRMLQVHEKQDNEPE